MVRESEKNEMVADPVPVPPLSCFPVAYTLLSIKGFFDVSL